MWYRFLVSVEKGVGWKKKMQVKCGFFMLVEEDVKKGVRIYDVDYKSLWRKRMEDWNTM